MISLPATTPPPSLNIGSLPATTPLRRSKRERRGSLCLPPTPFVARNTEGSVLSACHHPPSVTQCRLSTCHHPPSVAQNASRGVLSASHHPPPSLETRRGRFSPPATTPPPSLETRAEGYFFHLPFRHSKRERRGSLCLPPTPSVARNTDHPPPSVT